jgi:hypothetical protein
MEKKNSGIAFRRIGGRIVPIKLDRQKLGNAGKGAALAGAGLGVGAAAGFVASKFHYNAALKENAALGFKAASAFSKKTGDLGGAKTLAKMASKAASESASLFRSGRVAKGLGMFFGGALIGRGVTKALEGTQVGKELQKHEITKLGIETGIGSLAALGIRAGYTHGFGRVTGWNALKHAFGRVLVRGARL